MSTKAVEPTMTDAVKSDVIQHVRTNTAASRLAEPEVETLVETVFDYLQSIGYTVTPPAAEKSTKERHTEPEAEHHAPHTTEKHKR